MSLPRSIRPEYSTTLPSTGKKIKYQPFSVREEKILIIAAEGEDSDEIGNAIKNVLEACVTSPADFSVNDLSLFDIEYLFLKTRGKSAGEVITVNVTDPDDESCTIKVEINLDKIGIKKDDDHTDLIDLGNDITIKMKYPGIEFFSEGLKLTDISTGLTTIAKCVSQIVAGEEVFSRADMTEDEILGWLEDLTTSQLEKIMAFFTTMPKLSHTLKLKNKNKGTDFVVVLEGLSDFF